MADDAPIQGTTDPTQAPAPAATQAPPAQANGATTASPAPVAYTPQPVGTSGLAIAGLVIGVLALLTSYLPIINNASFFLALVGLVLAIVGLIGINKGKKIGKGMAVAGIILNALSIVVVLATQMMYTSAIDQAADKLSNGPQPVGIQSTTAASQSQATQQPSQNPQAAQDGQQNNQSAPAEAKDYGNLAIGEPVEFDNGLVVVVNSVETGLTNYNGEAIVGVNVSYTNNSNKNQSFNVYDWKSENASGVLHSQSYYSEAHDQLNSGQLSPGGSVSGNVYFEGDSIKVYYYNNFFQSNSQVSWAIG